MRYKDVPPFAPILMESTRAIGYSIEAAIADVIDNSIAAKASKIDIDFFPLDGAYISILDNGKGMDENELVKAMQYGSRNPLDKRSSLDLGRYGLGMKTASLSQCRVLTVISKQNDSVAGAQWNLNHVNEAQSWSLIILDEQEIKSKINWAKLSEYKHGTLVIWEELDKFSIGDIDVQNAFSKKMISIREHLSLVFHRYLTGEQGLKKISIKMNNNPVVPADPFCIKKSQQLMDDESINVNGEKILVRPFILPHISKLTKKEIDEMGGKEGLRKKQGFYVYRNKRLIVGGTWFRLMRKGELSKLARVQVDIPNSLDDLWTLDIKKSQAIPPELVRKNLAIIIDKISEGSKRTWTYRGKKEVTDDAVHVWNRLITRDGGIIYEVNKEHPMFQVFKECGPEIEDKIKSIMDIVSTSLPLNQLYVDLTEDKKLVEEKGFDEVLEQMKILARTFSNNEDRISFIRSLICTENFFQYANKIDEAINRGDFYD